MHRLSPQSRQHPLRPLLVDLEDFFRSALLEPGFAQFRLQVEPLLWAALGRTA